MAEGGLEHKLCWDCKAVLGLHRPNPKVLKVPETLRKASAPDLVERMRQLSDFALTPDMNRVRFGIYPHRDNPLSGNPEWDDIFAIDAELNRRGI